MEKEYSIQAIVYIKDVFGQNNRIYLYNEQIKEAIKAAIGIKLGIEGKEHQGIRVELYSPPLTAEEVIIKDIASSRDKN